MKKAICLGVGWNVMNCKLIWSTDLQLKGGHVAAVQQRATVCGTRILGRPLVQRYVHHRQVCNPAAVKGRRPHIRVGRAAGRAIEQARLLLSLDSGEGQGGLCQQVPVAVWRQPCRPRSCSQCPAAGTEVAIHPASICWTLGLRHYMASPADRGWAGV